MFFGPYLEQVQRFFCGLSPTYFNLLGMTIFSIFSAPISRVLAVASTVIFSFIFFVIYVIKEL